MSQVSSYLRRYESGYLHFCPGCQELHKLPDNWTFNGDLNKPTFTPSFKHTGIKRNIVNGKWIGEGRDAWLYDSEGNPIPEICHYILTNGVLNYCGDCTHSLANQSIPLPPLPEEFQD